MEKRFYKGQKTEFHPLKLTKKEPLTKNVFVLEFEIPADLQQKYTFAAGQYVTLMLTKEGSVRYNDFSMTNAPQEKKISLGIRCNGENSFAAQLYKYIEVGQQMEVSLPQGRFTVGSKPHEFRTIIAFAGGIGITPILSHFKNILHSEPRTRLFLFYGNRYFDEVPFKNELDALQKAHGERLQIFYFFSREEKAEPLFRGRLDGKKAELIINQILHLDDTDEESTIWDSVDEVLICGKGDMIKTLANTCFQNGIPKKNIHFELFEEYNEGIYPVEKSFPLVQDITVDFQLFGKKMETTFKDNRLKLLQQLLDQGFPVPYSCKSGICGSCECRLLEGDIELLENEYLTEKEEADGKILACMSVILSRRVRVDFDTV